MLAAKIQRFEACIFGFIPDQKSAGFDMAFPQALNVALKTMHSVLWLKRHALRNSINDGFKLEQIFATLARQFEVPQKPICGPHFRHSLTARMSAAALL